MKRRCGSWLYFWALVVFSLRALAAGPDVSASCRAMATSQAMRLCENARLAQAEAALKQTYETLLNGLDDKGRRKLRAAQRAWLAFRKADAAFLADCVRDGTLAPLVGTAVAADMTEARRAMLEPLLRR